MKVPAGSITGAITITARGGDGVTGSFTVYQPPTLTTVTPNFGKAGAVISVAGTNLIGATFRIGGVVATPAPSVVATATTAKIVVPAGASVSSAAGDSSLSVTTNGGEASKPFTIVGAPAISSLSSNSAVVGTELTITGSRLLNPSASPSASPISVKIGGTTAVVKTGASSTQLVVTVPLTAVSGSTTLSVTTLAGTVATSLTVIPLAPTVTSLGVTSQNRGSVVRINGTNLLNASVTIGGVSATISAGATATAMNVIVPLSAPTGLQTVVVTTAGGSDNTKSLTVKVQAPSISGVSQSGSKRGVGTVTVTGSFLTGATIKVGSVTVASSAVSVNGAGTSVTFTIPATAIVTQFATITITTSGGVWQSLSGAQKVAVTA